MTVLPRSKRFGKIHHERIHPALDFAIERLKCYRDTRCHLRISGLLGDAFNFCGLSTSTCSDSVDSKFNFREYSSFLVQISFKSMHWTAHTISSFLRISDTFYLLSRRINKRIVCRGLHIWQGIARFLLKHLLTSAWLKKRRSSQSVSWWAVR